MDHPSQLDSKFIEAFSSGTLYLHAMHSGVDFFAFAVWKNGTLQRSLSLSPDSGILDDIGPRLPFEVPFWAGEHPAVDPDDKDDSYLLPSFTRQLRRSISEGVSAASGSTSGHVRLSIVSQKMRQLTMQKTEIKLASRSAVRSRDSSALHPDFRILWNVSIFQRMAYQSSFSIASRRDETGRSVINFHSMGFRFAGASRSRAWITVKRRAG